MPEPQHRVLSREAWAVVAIAAASLALRAAVAARCDLFQDEGLYWWEARAADTGFAPHPPATSLLARLGLGAFGHGLLGLRAGSLACGTLAIAAVYLLGRDLFGRRAGLWAAALYAVTPLFAGVACVTTPDAPLLAAWLLFVWAAWKAATGGGGRWWALAAVLLAVGLYTKYMMVLAMPGLVAALWASPQGRSALRTRAPWLALAGGLALFVPAFLAWDWHRGWPALRYHLAARHAWGVSARQLGVYLAAHTGVLSPVLHVGLLTALVASARRRVEPRHAWVAAFGLVPILFFLLPSVLTKRKMVRMQWDATGYAVAAVALAAAMCAGAPQRRWRGWRPLGLAGLLVAALLSAGLMAGSLRPELAAAAVGRPFTLQMLGWSRLADRVRQARAEWDGEPLIVGESFATLFCLGFHLQQQEGLYTLYHSRNRQYGLTEKLRAWQVDELGLREAMARREARDGQAPDVLYVHDHRVSGGEVRDPDPERIHRYFASVQPLGHVDVALGGRLFCRFGLFAAKGWRGKDFWRGPRSPDGDRGGATDEEERDE